MALNIATDAKFDQMLEWLARQEKKNKSELVRKLVQEHFQALTENKFRYGALSRSIKEPIPSRKAIVKELKEMDDDRDLD